MVYADWWQWLRSAVPTQRWSDAWLYLCMAIQPYRQSEERQYAGLPQERCEGMAKEGGRLLSAMEDWLVHQISVLWHTMEQSGENATESYRTY
ncbi:hypothetical protein GCM10025857_00590 [Alicyclobacillus contaminans]|nr:hypothetical protein GCM10025857_00590 [Alicyclobacillus contaminans]